MTAIAPSILVLAFLKPGGQEVPAGTPDMRADPEALPRFFHEAYAALEASRPPPPADAKAFAERRDAIRARHAKALGIEPVHTPSPVTWRLVGTIDRGDHEVRKIVFDNRKGLPIPAHLYLPKARSGRLPAVLCVHGHWGDAKSAAPVQIRSAFLAKRGYAVLALDAIGAGERAWQDAVKGRIGYHGRQLGYGVLPSGLTLAGLQVEDNRRAIDLLRSLPEVDPERIGCTGASGGGNQTFHITVMDDRIRAAVPVCFFGAFRGYLEGAHCACEMVPGVLRHAEEGDLAGCIAPRPLMVIAAIKDQGAAFRIEDARRSIALARKYYEAAGAADRCRLLEFDCGHDYNREMREAMVAFFDRHLRGIDAGDRVPEPEIPVEKVEDLRCFPENGNGKDALSVPAIAAGRTVLVAAGERDAAADREAFRRLLRDDILGGFPRPVALRDSLEDTVLRGGQPVITTILLRTEPGISVGIELRKPATARPPARAVVILQCPGGASSIDPATFDPPPDTVLVRAWLRGSGPTAWPAAAAVDCPDYLLAQGAGVLGRPALGMWAFDAIRAVEVVAALEPGVPIGVFGEGAAGTVALIAAALDDRIAAAGTADALGSFAFAGRFDDRWPLGLFAPGIARAGDLMGIAAAVEPRPLAIGRPRDGGGAALDGAAAARLRSEIGACVGSGKEVAEVPSLRIEPAWGPAEVLGNLLEALASPKPAGAKTGAVWKVSPLHTGICWMGKNHLLGDPYADEERVPFAIISFLLEGPGGALGLVDFGPKDPAYFNESFRRYGLFRERSADHANPDDVVQPEGNVLDHLRRLAIDPARVSFIVLTHMHYDHLGGSRPPDPGLLKDFPGAVLHISKRGWDDNLSKRVDGWRWTSYVDFDVSQEILRRIESGRGRAADDEEILPGLRTRYLGGHCPCSQAVLVDTPRGTAVIAGDVVYRYEYLEAGIVARERTSAEDFIGAASRVVGLVEETGGVLVPCHDPSVLEACRRSGEGWLDLLRPASDRAVRGFRALGGKMRILGEQRNKG